MREILADLVAEQQGLDQSLQRAPDRDWKVRVVAGVTVQDTIAILAWGEQHAAAILTGAAKVGDLVATYGDRQAFERAGAAEGKGRRPQEIIEWWRFARADVVDALSRLKPSDQVPWIDGKVSAKTFATIRLADTWFHGLGILTSLKKEIVETGRLRHIAWLGWATLPHAFEVAGEDPVPIRVELAGPAYARWSFGPDEAPDVIRGPAGDWCRLAVGHTKDTGELTATGDGAARALEIAGIFV